MLLLKPLRHLLLDMGNKGERWKVEGGRQKAEGRRGKGEGYQSPFTLNLSPFALNLQPCPPIPQMINQLPTN